MAELDIAHSSREGSDKGTNRNNDATDNNRTRKHIAIQARRRQVAAMLAQSRTENEIASELGVDQSTVSRDIGALKDDSRHFVHNLAKSDLVFSFQQSIKGIDEVKRRLWDMVISSEYRAKEKLLAYRLIIVAEESKFRLLEKGPLLLNQQFLEERINRLEREERPRPA